MSTYMPELLFIPTGSKTNKRGLVPIILRITYAGRRAEHSTGIRIAPADWDQTRQRIKGDSKAVAIYNKKLIELKAEAYEAADKLKAPGSDKPLTAANVSKALKYTPPVQHSPDAYTALSQARERHYAHGNENTYQNQRYALAAWQTYCNNKPMQLLELTKDHTAGFVLWLQQHKARSTGATYVGNLATLFGKAAPELPNPFKGAWVGSTARAKPLYRLSREQIKALSALAGLPPVVAMARAVYLTQYYLHGSRVGAVLKLRWESIDWQQNRVRFVTDKRQVFKNVALTDNLRAILQQLGPQSAGYVFDLLPPEFADLPKAERLVLHKRAVARVDYGIKSLGRRLGLGEIKLHSHTARHTLATHVARQTKDIKAVQSMLAHASQKQTEAYLAELSYDEVDAAAASVYDTL